MCLAIPGRVIEAAQAGVNRIAKVQFGGVTRQIYLDFVPDAHPGDYILAHVGFAISVIDQAEAERTFALLEEIGSFDSAAFDPNDPGRP
ncbi:MAG TPA: HypC/HybG/HupF family hydrogenase formation chaperone [Candidatus Sulfopaludibacter sp.]|jgi:hydrogenase expression/formation protein HypC|nr:HypC/HybG/HupF family hydrogenase formation chaperone [Candidatus Sulfopaludibacter sp.]